MSGWRAEDQASGLFAVVFVSLLVYLLCLEFLSRRKARKHGALKEIPAHGRIVAWMLLGWFVGWLAPHDMTDGPSRRAAEASSIVHGAILGAVLGVVFELMREHALRQLAQLGSQRRLSPWRFSLRSLLLFMAVVGMICVCIRLYIELFVF